LSDFQIGILCAVNTGVCWALLAIVLKYALHFASTGTVAWVRMVFATGLLLLYYIYRAIFVQKSFKHLRDLVWPIPYRLIVAGLFLTFNYYGYMKGLELTTASNGQVMTQVGPLTLILLGVFYFKEHLRWQQLMGVVIAVLGFLLFNWDQLALTFEHSATYTAGTIWILLAGFSWATFAALQKIQLRKRFKPQEINMIIYFISMVALMPCATISELRPLSLWQWLVLASLGLNTVMAYGTFAEAIQRIPASMVSLITSLNPLLTLLLVWLISYFGFTFITPEPVHWRGYLGAVLVASGVAVAVSARRQKLADLSTDTALSPMTARPDILK
jgi:drug/metabolite transporter (DMT)-like permease